MNSHREDLVHPVEGAPYHTIEDLPDEIRDDLPRHAQELYLQAYNEAWRDYDAHKNTRIKTTREAVAHRVALWAVQNVYDRDEETGLWLFKM